MRSSKEGVNQGPGPGPPVHRRLRGGNGRSEVQEVGEGHGGDQLTRMLLMDTEAWALPLGLAV